VNTRSIVIGSGFALPLQIPTKAVLSVGAAGIFRRFAQSFKQQQQRSVKRSCSMSTATILVREWKPQIDMKIDLRHLESDQSEVRPIGDPKMVVNSPMAAIAIAYPSRVRVNKVIDSDLERRKSSR
jgi:hypothetical protein